MDMWETLADKGRGCGWVVVYLTASDCWRARETLLYLTGDG